MYIYVLISYMLVLCSINYFNGVLWYVLKKLVLSLWTQPQKHRQGIPVTVNRRCLWLTGGFLCKCSIGMHSIMYSSKYRHYRGTLVVFSLQPNLSIQFCGHENEPRRYQCKYLDTKIHKCFPPFAKVDNSECS